MCIAVNYDTVCGFLCGGVGLVCLVMWVVDFGFDLSSVLPDGFEVLV